MHDENQMSQNPRSADFPMTWQQQSLDMTGTSECQKSWVGQAYIIGIICPTTNRDCKGQLNSE